MGLTITNKELCNGNVIAIYQCPECKSKIKASINWSEDYFDKREDLKGGEVHICSCVSGGVYSVYFECPKCHAQINIV